MDPNTFPTKGNLILAKNSLALSRQGFELMDKKRNILIREMMELIDQAKDIQSQIDVTFRAAYAALQKVNMEMVLPLYSRFPTPFLSRIPFGSRHEALWVRKFHSSNMKSSLPTPRLMPTTAQRLLWMKQKPPSKR